jgi:hypothetical protein
MPYWVGGYTNAPGGTTQARALFTGPVPTPVFKTGDVVGNSGGQTLHVNGPGFGERFSALGTHWITTPQLSGPTANDMAVVVDASVIDAGGSPVREGLSVPASVGGLAGELWALFDTVAINEAGTSFVTGDTNAATTVDEFVMVKDTIVLREGAAVNTSLGAGVVSGAIEWGDMNESEDWAVTWDVTVAAVNREALIVNGQVVLLEGDLVDWNGDGVINASDNNGRLSDFNGSRAVAVGEVQGGSFFDVFFTADVDFNGTTTLTDDLEAGFSYRFIIPEPGSLSLLAASGAALLFRRRRG